MSSKQPNKNPELADFEVVINNALINFNHPSILKDDSVIETGKIAKKFFNTQKKGSGLLPPVIRSISGDFRYVMVERPPMEVKLNYTPEFRTIPADQRKPMQFSLYIPWTIWVMNFEDKDFTGLHCSFIYFRNSVISSDEEILYVAPLPNIYPGSSKICNAKDINKVLKKSINKGDIAQAINCVISCFWDSNFNEDMQTVPHDVWGVNKGSDVDKQYISLLSNWALKSEDEILATKFDTAEKFSPINTGGVGGILTVGDWVEYIDSYDSNSYADAGITNPLLTFFNGLKS